VPSVPGVLVDIVRDFFAAHQLMRRLFDRYRKGELRFEELEAFVGDDEDSVLFRLKERCHALFRPGRGGTRMANPREALFDLAVGSLFHEAMKFRENFYQREIYGPRVRALRSAAGEEADPFFREFEKIMATISERLEEGLQETETLVDQTGEQLRVLLAEHAGNGYLARYLTENAKTAEAVFGEDLDVLLDEIHGGAAAGFALAGRSYLTSGYYQAADRAFAEAIARGGDEASLSRLQACARGLAAYLAGDYAACVACLFDWIDGGEPLDPGLVDLAHAAVSRIEKLAEGADRERVAREASELLARLGPRPDGRAPERAA
jgi:hypothetical protein